MPGREEDDSLAEEKEFEKRETRTGAGGTSVKDSELRRNLRWTSFARPKVVLGFDLLSPAYVPSMARNCQGLCMCIEKISGWRPPVDLRQSDDANDTCVSLSVNISLYHFNSVSFFGNTWSSDPVPLQEGSAVLPEVLNVDLSDVIYMLSRINDPSCILVAEVVAIKENVAKNVVTGTFGCGWTQIPLFSSQHPDISHGYENADPTVCTGTSPYSMPIHSRVCAIVALCRDCPA